MTPLPWPSASDMDACQNKNAARKNPPTVCNIVPCGVLCDVFKTVRTGAQVSAHVYGFLAPVRCFFMSPRPLNIFRHALCSDTKTVLEQRAN